MLQNNVRKIENKNRMQTKEILRKNNLKIDCPSFIPNYLKKCNNSNDYADDNFKQVSIGLNETINYYTFSQEFKYNDDCRNEDLRNFELNTDAKEYIPKNNKAKEYSEKIEYIEHNTNSIEQSQKKKENSQNDDYYYLEIPEEFNFKSYSNYSHSSKSSSSTNINASESCADHLIKKELNELLNKLKKNIGENNENIRIQIFEKIKNKNDYQEMFIDVFFYEVCMKSTNVELYAKLFKNLDKELSQKYKVKEEGKRISSKFRTKLIENCQKVFKGENYENFLQNENPNQRKNKLKKLIIGNINFISELIKIKMLSKKNIPNCIEFLFTKYKSEKDIMLKNTHLVAIIVFIENFERIIIEDKSMKEEEVQSYMESIDEMIKELELIQEEVGIHILHMILDLKQDYINIEIKRDIINYKDFVEKNGNSEKYPWDITTYLYDISKKNFADLIEGYFLACCSFIEKENDIKYAKNYIRELIEFYHKLINSEEKEQLQSKIFDLLEKANTSALKNIYSYVIYIFIVNEIMDVKSLENITRNIKMINEDHLNSISIIYKNIYKYIKNEIFKNILQKFVFIDKNKRSFKWVYESDLEREIVKND